MKTLNRSSRPVSYLTAACLVAGLAFATYVLFTRFGGRLTEVIIEIEPTRDGLFLIQQLDIERRLDESPYKAILGHSVKHVALDELENYLSEDPFVASAEVYVRFDGRMYVTIEQHEPILRVHDRSGADYYVSPVGDVLPLSKHAVARVPVLTGDVRPFNKAVRDTTAIDAYVLAQRLAADELFGPLIEQIELRHGEYTLVPKVGNGVYLIGDLDDLDAKLDRLKTFILGVYPETGWEYYSRVDVRYDKLAFGQRNPRRA